MENVFFVCKHKRRIYSIWKSEHFDDPIVDEASGREGNPDRTTLTLPMVESKRKKQAEKTSGKSKRKKRTETVRLLKHGIIKIKS